MTAVSNPTSDTTEPIYEASRACSGILDSFISTTPRSSDLNQRLVELRGQFNRWAAYVGAFAAPKACLDARLAAHDTIREMIVDLLSLIQQNLQWAKATVAENTATSSPEVNPIFEPTADDYVGFPVIEETLSQLFRVAAILRRSSRRILQFPVEDDRSTSRSIREAFLRRKYPDMPQTLLKQLSHSMFQRELSMDYLFTHNKKLAHHRDNVPTHGDPLDEDYVPPDDPDSISAPENQAFSSSRKLLHALDTIPTDPSPSTKSNIARRMKKPSGSVASTGSIVAEASHDHSSYPAIPSQATCPICGVPKKFSEMKQIHWCVHVDQDLEPFLCLSEQCREPLRFFKNSDQWESHMQSHHTVRWAETIHTEKWYCEVDHAEYDDPKSLEAHLVKQHADLKLTNSRIQGKMRRNKRIATRDPFVCPLCACVPEEVVKRISEKPYKLLWEHVGQHLKSLALLSLPYERLGGGSDSSKNLSSNKNADQVTETPDGSIRKTKDDETIFADIPETIVIGDGICEINEVTISGDGTVDSTMIRFEDDEAILSTPVDWGLVYKEILPGKCLSTNFVELERGLQRKDDAVGQSGEIATQARQVQSSSEVYARNRENKQDPPLADYASSASAASAASAASRQFRSPPVDAAVALATSKPPNSGASESEPSENSETISLSPPDLRYHAYDSRYELQAKIIASFQQTRNHHGQDQDFLPLSALHHLINTVSVTQELTRVFGHYTTSDEVGRQVQVICSETQVSVHGKMKIKTFRKIFALLVLVGKTSSIMGFLEEDVSDLDLPLVPLQPRSAFGMCRRNVDGVASNIRLQCFEDPRWSPIELRTFQEYQWKLLAPFFSQGKHGNVLHYILHDQHILPFVLTEGEKDTPAEKTGGYSKVFMVKIHPEHHNFQDETLSLGGFAIKQQLHAEDRHVLKNEISALKIFSGDRGHNHIISLLATYEQFQKLHLIFYRAQGDLFAYWADIERQPKLMYNDVLWVATQCEGLTSGLLRLHKHLTFDERSYEAAVLGSKRVTSESSKETRFHSRESIDENDSTPRKLYGRHGDINPANILWFDGVEREPGVLKGTLKLADFGQTEFNSHRSRTKPRDVATTLTYRPPECDHRPRHEPPLIRQTYDIWCLGCVFLEFITWVLGGDELQMKFVESRMSPDLFENQMLTDTFFQVVRNPDKDHVLEVMVKNGVIRFVDELHRHPDCTEYIHEFLNLIQFDMLVIDSGQRQSCDAVWKTLRRMLNRCRMDKEYAVDRKPWSFSMRPTSVAVLEMEVQAETSKTEISSPPTTRSGKPHGGKQLNRKARRKAKGKAAEP